MKGNALAFLEKKETFTRTKSAHNAQCKEKIDRHIKKNGSTKCEDYCLIQTGMQKKAHRVNEMAIFRGSIDGIHARMFKKREPKPCVLCKEMFTPTRIRREPTLHEKKIGAVSDGFSSWCSICRHGGTAYREKIKSVGSRKRYLEINEKRIKSKEIMQVFSLRILFEQKDINRELLAKTKGIDKQISRVLDKAYKQNKIYDENFHYEFDF